MDPLPPIPTPPGQRWREFRVRALPFIVFAGIVLLTAYLWRFQVLPTNLVGQVESVTASVTATQPGLLAVLNVDRFTEVTNGQEIAVVWPFDPELTRAGLAAISADLDVSKTRMDLTEMARMDAAVRMRLELDAQRLLFSVAKVQLAEAENVFQRATNLFKDNINSQAQLDLARANRDHWKIESEDRAKIVVEWERQVAAFGPRLESSSAGMSEIFKRDIEKQQEQLRQLQKPMVLRAPISGKVSAVLHRAGERIPAGLPIVTITPIRPERIVAYVRQPIIVHPQIGDTVRVMTRTPQRRVSFAQVLQVGTQMEPINPILLPMIKPAPEEGLPIAISLPAELELLPGEIVNLNFTMRRK